MGVSVIDIAQTLQLSLSGQRFGYFMMNGKQYQVIGQFDKKDRNKPMDLTSIFVKNTEGRLIQLDNVVTIEEKVVHHSFITITVIWQLPFQQD